MHAHPPMRLAPFGHLLRCICLIFLVNVMFSQVAGAAQAGAAQAGPAQAPRPQSTPAPTAPAQPAQAQAEGPAQSPVGNDYVIGPGDTVQVFVWRNPELTTTVPVRPDGKISTPLVEDMVAVGKTPSQLARDIETVLSEYVRSPQINVIVTQPASALSQVQVIGQVVRPSPIPYRDGLTVLDAVLAVGGLGPFAAGNRAKIVRTENGKQREIKVKISDLVNEGDLRQNIKLQPGDVVVVPQSRF